MEYVYAYCYLKQSIIYYADMEVSFSSKKIPFGGGIAPLFKFLLVTFEEVYLYRPSCCITSVSCSNVSFLFLRRRFLADFFR